MVRNYILLMDLMTSQKKRLLSSKFSSYSGISGACNWKGEEDRKGFLRIDYDLVRVLQRLAAFGNSEKILGKSSSLCSCDLGTSLISKMADG